MIHTLNTDSQGLRPHAEVLAEYREQWPLLDAWDATRRANTREEHQADEKPQDWAGLLGAAALDLGDTAEGRAEGRAYVDKLVTDANNALTTGNPFA